MKQMARAPHWQQGRLELIRQPKRRANNGTNKHISLSFFLFLYIIMLRNLGRQCFSSVRMRPQYLGSCVRFQHAAATATQPACWQCGAAQQHATVLCADCQAIQPVTPNVNYYELLLEGYANETRKSESNTLTWCFLVASNMVLMWIPRLYDSSFLRCNKKLILIATHKHPR